MHVDIRSRERLGLQRRRLLADTVRRQLSARSRYAERIELRVSEARAGLVCVLRVKVRRRVFIVRQRGVRMRETVRIAARRLRGLLSPVTPPH